MEKGRFLVIRNFDSANEIYLGDETKTKEVWTKKLSQAKIFTERWKADVATLSIPVVDEIFLYNLEDDVIVFTK